MTIKIHKYMSESPFPKCNVW